VCVVALSVALAMVLLTSGSRGLLSDQHRATADSISKLIIELDDLSTVADSLSNYTASVQERYTADSLRWQREREELRLDVDAADRERRSLSVALEQYMAGDSAGLALLDSLNAQHAIVVAGLVEENSTLQQERAALLESRALLLQGLNLAKEQLTISVAAMEQQGELNLAIAAELQKEKRRARVATAAAAVVASFVLLRQ
jgi:hypothetical protein